MEIKIYVAHDISYFKKVCCIRHLSSFLQKRSVLWLAHGMAQSPHPPKKLRCISFLPQKTSRVNRGQLQLRRIVCWMVNLKHYKDHNVRHGQEEEEEAIGVHLQQQQQQILTIDDSHEKETLSRTKTSIFSRE